MKKLIYIFFLFPIICFGQQIIDLNSVQIQVGPQPTCSDGIQNGNETGIDCGGSCSPCSDPVATVVATDNSASEAGLTTGYFTVSLDAVNNSGSSININYNITGTATSGSDFTALSGTASITNGSQVTTVTVTPLDDSLVEGAETVVLTIASGTGYQIGSPNNDTITITSDDSSGSSILASVLVTDNLATETSSNVGVFTVSLSEVNSGSTVTVNYHMDGLATEGSDYTSTSGSVDIINGSQSATVTITPLNDGNIESDETVMIVLDTGAGYSLEGLDRAIIEIIDNDDVSSSYPTTSGTSTITSLADFTNASNIGTRATVTGTFDATGATAASGMVLVAGGGLITGSNINLNGSGIENSDSQLFSATASFSSVYDLSRISIEMFGAVNGSGDDHASIETAWNNAQHLTCRLNGNYINNDHATISRTGVVDWDLNGATIQTTSAANFNTGSFSVDELFRLSNIQPFIYNGTFDLTDTYGRLFRLLTYTKFSFKDLIMENFYNPQPIRSYAIRASSASALEYGDFVRNTFRDITAQGDGSANNSDGISKGIWMECGTISDADFEIVHYGNTYHDITGDDAEAVYYTASGDRIHNGHTLFDNETYYDIGRRAIKMTKGQFTIQNSDFTEIQLSKFVSASLTATNIDIFSTSSTDLRNIKVVNNQIKTATGEEIKRWLLSVTDSQDILFKGNTINVGIPNSLGAIRLGSNTSSYDGLLRNTVIKNNTLINSTIEWMQYFDGSASSKTIIDNNTFTFNSVGGGGMAPLDFYHVGSDLKGYGDFTNNTITYNVSPSAYDGIISSDGASISVTEMLIDNNDIIFNSGSATYEIGNIAGNLTNSTISNNTVTGGSGNSNLNIVGSSTGTTASGNTPTVSID